MASASVVLENIADNLKKTGWSLGYADAQPAVTQHRQ
jgi:hypothetical protein